MPHFVNFDVYKDYSIEPTFDLMFAGRLDTDYRLSFFEELILKLPHLRVAWYAIDKHYHDAKKRAQFPEILDLCYQGFIDNEEDMAKAINNAKIIANLTASELNQKVSGVKNIRVNVYSANQYQPRAVYANAAKGVSASTKTPVEYGKIKLQANVDADFYVK